MNTRLVHRILSFLAIAAFSVTATIACQVPVFRYALERWPPDKYEIVVLHEGTLDSPNVARVKTLHQLGHTAPTGANFSVRVVQVEKTENAALKELWLNAGTNGKPAMAVLYPENAQDVPNRVAHVGPFEDEALRQLVDSPLRQTIIKRLIGGESAVWIFVPSGQEEQDTAALKRLREQVQSNENDLELPEQEEVGTEEELLAEVNIELRLDFSIVTLDRNDPKEQMLLRLLLQSEADLADLDQPMAFPVLGRGRVLYALIGPGISAETIEMASRFIIGPCSCQVKEQNPGFDLLMSVNWDKEIGTDKLSDPLPQRSAKPTLLKIPPGRKK